MESLTDLQSLLNKVLKDQEALESKNKTLEIRIENNKKIIEGQKAQIETLQAKKDSLETDTFSAKRKLLEDIEARRIESEELSKRTMAEYKKLTDERKQFEQLDAQLKNRFLDVAAKEERVNLKISKLNEIVALLQ